MILTYLAPGVIRVNDRAGAAAELRFTADGSLQQVTDPLGRTTRLVYDANGRAVEVIAADNSVTRFSYNAEGRLTSQTNALNQVATYSYGPNSESPTNLVDGKGNPLTYSYDSQGKVTSIGYADGSGETFTYNSTNQLIQKVERSGDTFTYSYNPRGLLASRGGGDFNETYGYDSQDRLIGVVRTAPGGGASQSVSYSYDSAGNLSQISQAGKSISYTYDSQGRRSSYSTSDGATVRYNYDSAGRLQGLRDGSDQSLVSYLYDGDGRLILETNGNGTTSSYSYAAAGQLLRIDNANPAGTIVSSLVYTYDLLGRRTGETSNQGSWSYSYDANGQLVGADFTSSDPAVISNQSRQYVYDAAGNRISTLVNGVATSYSSNALNQYTSVGGAGYSYDADGNLLSDGLRSYEYNSENRMIRASAGADVWEYEYDLLGNRSAVIHNGQRTSYLVDPFAGFGDVVGTYNADGSLQARYVHGNGLVAGFAGSGSWYVDADAIGSIRSLSDGSGAALTAGLLYDPFGAQLSGGSGLSVAQGRFGFVGGWGVEQDASGLIHMRARQYDPLVGRFTATDPLIEKGGSLNLYGYAFNDPALYSDPTGLRCQEEIDADIASKKSRRDELTGELNQKRNEKEDLEKQINDSDSLIEEIEQAIPGFKEQITILKISLVEVALAITAATLAGLIPLSIALGITSAGLAATLLTAEAALDKLESDLPKEQQRNQTLKSRLGLVVDHIDSIQSQVDEVDSHLDALRNEEPTKCDPLVLDIDKNGLSFVALQHSQAYFDLDNNGFRERVSWVGTGEGLLVRDLNNNGRIDHLGEQFGDAVVNGFTALTVLDSNGDNFIDANDAAFNSLRIWIDRNGDGSTDNGELRTLADLNIQSIGLARVDRTNDPDGIRSTGSFTFSDGSTSTIAAIDLTIDRLSTLSSQEVQLKAETAYLPGLKGYGALSDLNVAMSQDPTLLGLMRDFVQLDASQLDQINAKIEAILFRWAGVDGIDPASRSAFFDARKHAFLEKFYQSSLDFSITVTQHASGLRHSWATIVAHYADRLAGQGFLRSLLNTPAFDASYLLSADQFLSSAQGAQQADHLQAILAAVQATLPADTSARLLTWSYALGALDAFADRFGLSEAAYATTLQSALGPELASSLAALRNPAIGSALNDDPYLRFGSGGVRANPGPLFLSGGDGDDRLTSGGGDDLLDGGSGNDRLWGFEGNDRLLGGAGNDTLDGAAGIDTLDGGDGNDTYIVDSTTDLILDSVGYDWVNSSVSFSLASLPFIEALRLTGTEAINGSGNDLANNLIGNSANNLLSGGNGKDVLNGGTGIDTLTGGAGSDTFQFTTMPGGANRDEITDFSRTSDKLSFSRAVFSGFGTKTSLSAGQFAAGAGLISSTTAQQRFIYDTASGILRFDRDGIGSTSALEVAILSGAPTLLSNNFLLTA